MDQLILILELVGTLAFAASGAMTALKKGMDLFGVCILGLTTAVGGGVIRDVIHWRSRSRPRGSGCFFTFVSSVKHHLMCLVLGGKRLLRFPLFCSAS